MLRSLLVIVGLWFVVICTGCTQVHSPPDRHAPVQEASFRESKKRGVRLLIWLTVDQMRGDYLEKYRVSLGTGGFTWLAEHGRSYEQVHYSHAITETAPGHATLFTGAPPRVHGIIANQWLLPDGTEVAAVTDKESLLVTVSESGLSTRVGSSPRQLLVPTLGDALIEQKGRSARVISVSGKDRGAILPGGLRGQAYWLGPEGFVTSSFYRKEVPDWLTLHQKAHPVASYLARGWSLFEEEEKYQSPASVLSYAPREWSAGFPHRLTAGADPMSAVKSSPFSDEAVIDVALSALAGEDLGRDDIPDLLAISLSATDMIGHQFGPESRELEDQLVRLDAQIARLVEHLNDFLDPDEFVLVLSADHGACESAEFLRKVGRHGRRLTEATLEEAVRKSLKQEYGHERYFLGVASPYVTLNRAAMLQYGVQVQGVRNVVAAALGEVEGVHLVHIVGDPVPAGELGSRLAAAIHSERSGDIYVVPERDTLLLQSESLGATHGSPWGYDTHVPLLLVGPGVVPGSSPGPFDVRSLAPTIAHLLGIDPPAAANAPLLPLGPYRAFQ